MPPFERSEVRDLAARIDGLYLCMIQAMDEYYGRCSERLEDAYVDNERSELREMYALRMESAAMMAAHTRRSYHFFKSVMRGRPLGGEFPSPRGHLALRRTPSL
jgi:hypothetical protein